MSWATENICRGARIMGIRSRRPHDHRYHQCLIIVTIWLSLHVQSIAKENPLPTFFSTTASPDFHAPASVLNSIASRTLCLVAILTDTDLERIIYGLTWTLRLIMWVRRRDCNTIPPSSSCTFCCLSTLWKAGSGTAGGRIFRTGGRRRKRQSCLMIAKTVEHTRW